MSASRVSRRRFLAGSAAATAALASPAILRALDTNGRINLGFIASGGRARANLSEMTKPGGVEINIVALCDVNGQNLEKAAQQYPKARLYK
ncbi:MAG: twin-arginine translocation signal domain-containing protein, partial [Planctomycetia bacterium]|nr:twin-arginine translocation signal domain-containing protein [Planctomycetia bacterium]